MATKPKAVLGGTAWAGAAAAVAGIAGTATALRSPAVVRRLNNWAARKLTDAQRADRLAAILPTPIPGPSFYSEPDDLTSRANGEIVRTHRVFPRIPLPGLTIQRFMVRSTDTAGNAVPVTATLIEPNRPWWSATSRSTRSGSRRRPRTGSSAACTWTCRRSRRCCWHETTRCSYPIMRARGWPTLRASWLLTPY